MELDWRALLYAKEDWEQGFEAAVTRCGDACGSRGWGRAGAGGAG